MDALQTENTTIDALQIENTTIDALQTKNITIDVSQTENIQTMTNDVKMSNNCLEPSIKSTATFSDSDKQEIIENQVVYIMKILQDNEHFPFDRYKLLYNKLVVLKNLNITYDLNIFYKCDNDLLNKLICSLNSCIKYIVCNNRLHSYDILNIIDIIMLFVNTTNFNNLSITNKYETMWYVCKYSKNNEYVECIKTFDNVVFLKYCIDNDKYDEFEKHMNIAISKKNDKCCFNKTQLQELLQFATCKDMKYSDKLLEYLNC